MNRKKSFFERLTGTVKSNNFDDDDDLIEEEEDFPNEDSIYEKEENTVLEDIGQLSIDVINTPDYIIIKSMIAGVKPQDLDIQISRDMVTIKGNREEEMEVNEEDYYHRELYWGSFARNILLPEEIDVDAAEAKEKHGLLVIRLPKLDKNRKTKLSVKSN